MGGMIAQQIAVRHPAVVRSLVVHCPWWEADPYTSALIRSWQAIGRATGMLELSRQIWLWVFTPRYYAEHPEAFVELERQVGRQPSSADRGRVLRPGRGGSGATRRWRRWPASTRRP